VTIGTLERAVGVPAAVLMGLGSIVRAGAVWLAGTGLLAVGLIGRRLFRVTPD